MANLAIRGHKTRGGEVIKILEMLGGKSYTVYAYKGEDPDRCYCINKENNFIDSPLVLKGFQVFSLEEFLKKFPYKVGDRVKTSLHFANCIGTVKRMRWEQNENVIIYDVEWSDANKSTLTYYAQGLRPYKEQETMDKANKAVFDANSQCCDIMNHLIKEETLENKPNLLQQLKEYFDNTPRDVLEKEWNELSYLNEIGPTVDEYLECVKKYRQSNQYPKTYEECHELMVQWKEYDCNPNSELILCDAPIHDFCKLIVARNIYWKIAGEQMGLGKPWEPDWNGFDNNSYSTITKCNGRIVKTSIYTNDSVLAFPTTEMRDAFYENFKDLIEQCKELL